MQWPTEIKGASLFLSNTSSRRGLMHLVFEKREEASLIRLVCLLMPSYVIVAHSNPGSLGGSQLYFYPLGYNINFVLSYIPYVSYVSILLGSPQQENKAGQRCDVSYFLDHPYIGRVQLSHHIFTQDPSQNQACPSTHGF